MEASFALFLRLTRLVDGRRERTEFVFHAERLRGRFSLAVLAAERLVSAKMDGWPEVTN
jgi:hypothetical protein